MTHTSTLVPCTLTAVLLLNIPSRLSACSCVGESTVANAVKYADAVFIGTVISKEDITLTDSAILKMFPDNPSLRKSHMAYMTIARYSFVVQKRYKGETTADTIAIYTGLGGGDCGVQFQVNKQYIIYGQYESYFGSRFPKQENTYWTNICSRTTMYNDEENAVLEKLKSKNK
jgi:hypothetical protein